MTNGLVRIVSVSVLYRCGGKVSVLVSVCSDRVVRIVRVCRSRCLTVG